MLVYCRYTIFVMEMWIILFITKRKSVNAINFKRFFYTFSLTSENFVLEWSKTEFTFHENHKNRYSQKIKSLTVFHKKYMYLNVTVLTNIIGVMLIF